ncbi:uncharacterized protein LOC135105089 [Scylla paramamosain]|uniref:uncharacterized protein LOC135105089 n=1 Tax=Scylla paramamosain TaxID=85552 RepID=UPI00308365F3
MTSLTLDDVRVTVVHSHDGDLSSVEAEKLRCSIHEKTKTSRESTACILATAIQETPEPVRVYLGNQESLKRNIRRQKQGSLPKAPVSLREFHVPDGWSTTGGDTSGCGQARRRRQYIGEYDKFNSRHQQSSATTSHEGLGKCASPPCPTLPTIYVDVVVLLAAVVAAEPEAEAEAEPGYGYSTHGHTTHSVSYGHPTYSYSHGYPSVSYGHAGYGYGHGYGSYGHVHRLYKREAEAEPGYGLGHRTSYSVSYGHPTYGVSYPSYGYGHSYGYGFPSYGHTSYGYHHGIHKREADPEPGYINNYRYSYGLPSYGYRSYGYRTYGHPTYGYYH